VIAGSLKAEQNTTIYH